MSITRRSFMRRLALFAVAVSSPAAVLANLSRRGELYINSAVHLRYGAVLDGLKIRFGPTGSLIIHGKAMIKDCYISVPPARDDPLIICENTDRDTIITGCVFKCESVMK